MTAVEAAHLLRNPGCIDQNIDSTVVLANLPNGLSDSLNIAYIYTMECCVDASLLSHVSSCLVANILLDIENCNAANANFCKCLSHVEPETTTGAGRQC
jgi:hypothetical protein